MIAVICIMAYCRTRLELVTSQRWLKRVMKWMNSQPKNGSTIQGLMYLTATCVNVGRCEDLTMTAIRSYPSISDSPITQTAIATLSPFTSHRNS